MKFYKGGNPKRIERIMASDAFLNSIEINFKKAAQYIQKIDGNETIRRVNLNS